MVCKLFPTNNLSLKEKTGMFLCFRYIDCVLCMTNLHRSLPGHDTHASHDQVTSVPTVLLVEAKKQLTAQLDSHIPQVAAQCLATYVLIALQQITPNLAS